MISSHQGHTKKDGQRALRNRKNNNSQYLRKITGQMYLFDLDIADHWVVPRVLNMYDICIIIMLFAGWEVNEKL